MGTDLLITVNAPYPDQEAAMRSMASAECFSGVRPDVVSDQTSDNPAVAAPISTKDGHDGTVESGAAMALAGGSSGGAGVGAVGVATVQTVLKSFVILDWSLFC